MLSHLFHFKTGAVSHTGHLRDHNEDNYLVVPENGLWLVADGMGGHAGGDYASHAIVSHLAALGRPASAPDLQERFVHRLSAANAEIQDKSRDVGATIGSTVVALLIFEQHFSCIWSGDSRIYLLRDDRLTQVSRDHTEANDLLDRGVITAHQAETWHRKNVITRAVGVHADVRIDQKYGTLRDGDTFLLCSDGLNAHVGDAEIRTALQSCAPQEACDRLLGLTLERGASDNTTILVVKVASGARSPDGLTNIFDMSQSRM